MKSNENRLHKKVQAHTELKPLLKAMYEEFKELSKKKPDAAVSKSKILMVNRLLYAIREILVDEPNFKYLDMLDEDAVPQTSDVALVLSQYLAAMAAFREKHFSIFNDDFSI